MKSSSLIKQYAKHIDILYMILHSFYLKKKAPTLISEMNPQKFWTSLFEECNIVSKLADIASLGKEGQSFKTSNFGDVLVTCKPATVLGDGFMSDTFAIHGKTNDGTSYDAFAKVIRFRFFSITLLKLLLFTLF